MNKFVLPMNLQQFAQEKTEKATPKKRQEARRKGQVAKSNEVPGAFILLFTFFALSMFGGFYRERITRFYTVAYTDFMQMEMTNSSLHSMFIQLMAQILILILPIMLIAFLVAIAGNYIQIGFLLTGDPIMMKLNKLNPIEGAKRIFSTRALVEFLKSMFKLILIGTVVGLTLWKYRMTIVQLSQMPLEQTLTFAGKVTALIGLEIAALLVVLSIFDYIYQRYEFEKSQRMSKQDIKDEYKKSDGDPLIKGKIREKQRRMAMQRMMQEVPNADVIITNPTHYAIALKYDSDQMEAPAVIAKGKDYIALKMKEIALQHDLVIMENKPLARALYAQVEIGQAIPNDLFQAVAEVLAYVYKLKGKA